MSFLVIGCIHLQIKLSFYEISLQTNHADQFWSNWLKSLGNNHQIQGKKVKTKIMKILKNGDFMTFRE